MLQTTLIQRNLLASLMLSQYNSSKMSERSREEQSNTTSRDRFADMTSQEDSTNFTAAPISPNLFQQVDQGFYMADDTNNNAMSLTAVPESYQNQCGPVHQGSQPVSITNPGQFDTQYQVQDTHAQCPTQPGQQQSWEYSPSLQYPPFDVAQSQMQIDNTLKEFLPPTGEAEFLALLRQHGLDLSSGLPIERSQSDMGPATLNVAFGSRDASDRREPQRPGSSRSMFDFGVPSGWKSAARPITPVQENVKAVSVPDTFHPVTPAKQISDTPRFVATMGNVDSSDFTRATGYSSNSSPEPQAKHRSSVDFHFLESPSKTLGSPMANLLLQGDCSPMRQPMFYAADSPDSSVDMDGASPLHMDEDDDNIVVDSGITADMINVYLGENPDDAKMPYVCTFPGCKKQVKCFARRENAKSHISSTHLNDKTYKCKLCPARFTRQHDCKRHEGKHAPAEQKYHCTCKFNTPRKDALNRHWRRAICPLGLEKFPENGKKTPAKRGRPRTHRPDDAKRQSKSTRQRKLNAEKAAEHVEKASSPSIGSEYSYAAETSPVMHNVNLAQLMMPSSVDESRAFKGYELGAMEGGLSFTPPLSPKGSASCGVSSPGKDVTFVPGTDTPPGSPPELVHSPHLSVDEELPSRVITSRDGLSDDLFAQLLNADMMMKDDQALFVPAS